jgi:hypothetical protein
MKSVQVYIQNTLIVSTSAFSTSRLCSYFMSVLHSTNNCMLWSYFENIHWILWFIESFFSPWKKQFNYFFILVGYHLPPLQACFAVRLFHSSNTCRIFLYTFVVYWKFIFYFTMTSILVFILSCLIVPPSEFSIHTSMLCAYAINALHSSNTCRLWS